MKRFSWKHWAAWCAALLILSLATRTANTTATDFVDGSLATVSGGVAHFHLSDLTLHGGTGLKVEVFQGDGATMALVPGATYTFTVARSIRIPIPAATVGTNVEVRTTWQGPVGANKSFRLAVGWFRNPDPA